MSLNSVFDLLATWDTEHIIATSLSGAGGLLLPLWGAIGKIYRWFKEYKNANEAKRKEMLRKEKEIELAALTQAISNNLEKYLAPKKEESIDEPKAVF